MPRTPLAERLERLDPEVQAEFRAMVSQIDAHRPPLALESYALETRKAYRRRYRRYVEWCQEFGYQSDPGFITGVKLGEFLVYCASVKQYSVKTMWQTARALEVYAAGAGALLSRAEARTVIDSYRDALARVGLGTARRRGRRGEQLQLTFAA